MLEVISLCGLFYKNDEHKQFQQNPQMTAVKIFGLGKSISDITFNIQDYELKVTCK